MAVDVFVTGLKGGRGDCVVVLPRAPTEVSRGVGLVSAPAKQSSSLLHCEQGLVLSCKAVDAAEQSVRKGGHGRSFCRMTLP